MSWGWHEDPGVTRYHSAKMAATISWAKWLLQYPEHCRLLPAALREKEIFIPLPPSKRSSPKWCYSILQQPFSCYRIKGFNVALEGPMWRHWIWQNWASCSTVLLLPCSLPSTPPHLLPCSHSHLFHCQCGWPSSGAAGGGALDQH